jgi:hypothetical protein
MSSKLLLLAALAPLSFLGSAGQDSARQDQAGLPAGSAPINPYLAHRQAAIHMNEIAGQIHSPDDVRKLVDMLADMFADELPPMWATGSIRERIARAEYESVAVPADLIPEQRIVDAWNRYAKEIGAPDEALVNVEEIHYLRDIEYTSANLSWDRRMQTIWTMPNIYALGPNGKVADGCRALETVRVLWDIANMFENLRGAREQLRSGVLASDFVAQHKRSSAPKHAQASFGVGHMERRDNPVEAAERRYVREHGVMGMRRAIEVLVDDLFPAKSRG